MIELGLNKNKILILTLCIIILTTNNIVASASTVSHPKMYIDSNDTEKIKNNIGSNQEPWRMAYNRMILDANSTLLLTPSSVTHGGATPPSGDIHDYYTEAAYSSDGVYDPNADRTDYYAAMKLGKSVRDLGMAYAFTGDSKYAEKALDFIRMWTINPGTMMNPKFTSGSKVELAITLPGMFYGADLIWNYHGWDSSEKDKFKSWTIQMITNAKIDDWCFSNVCQNWENWRLVFISSASVIAEDTNSRNYAFDRWKELIPGQIDDQGKMINEIGRTRSLDYSTYAVNAMIQTAEIARHYDVDLYNYTLPDGRGLEKALDYHVPYIINPDSWPYQQITSYDGDNAAIYELAYLFKKKSSYKNVISKLGRPMYEKRIMGWVTLTHVGGYFSIIPSTPVPTIGPTPVPTIRIICYKKSKVK